MDSPSSSSDNDEAQYPSPEPHKASPAKSSRKSPARSRMDMETNNSDDSLDSDSDFDFEDDDEVLWNKYVTTDSTASKNERKTKALNNEVMKRLHNHRSKAKKLRLTSKTATPEYDPEHSFKLSPELKVGDFLSGDYTREIQLKNGLLRDLCGIWKSKEMSDVTIECEDGTIQAHKLLLSARSDVFRAMFESGMTETSSNIVKIDDIKLQTMNILIQFMYSGQIVPLTVAGMTDLIVAADKYQMIKLKEACFYELSRKMNTRNVGSIMLLATTHDCSSDIKLSIQKFLLRNTLRFSKLFQPCRYNVPFSCGPPISNPLKTFTIPNYSKESILSQFLTDPEKIIPNNPRSERQQLWKVAEFQEVAKAHPLVITTFLFEDFSFTSVADCLPINM